jgi:hypothetical protein
VGRRDRAVTARVVTAGSIFELDDDLRRYRRYPNREQPREKPEWSDERAGVLQDFVWHPMVSWHYRPTRWLDRDLLYAGADIKDCIRYGYRLTVVLSEPNEDGSVQTVSAPMPDDWEPT